MVSEIVEEPLDPGYNFLSLYTAMGVCAPHLDSPESKWTLDVCIDQSAPWPIYFSSVQPWPEASPEAWWQTESWSEDLKHSPEMHFQQCLLEPGQAVVFSGSSQWHYRDAMPKTSGRSFCTLLFFHFVPQGSAELVRPKNWARLFGIPELDEVR